LLAWSHHPGVIDSNPPLVKGRHGGVLLIIYSTEQIKKQTEKH
jgi:hypothetical protein